MTFPTPDSSRRRTAARTSSAVLNGDVASRSTTVSAASPVCASNSGRGVVTTPSATSVQARTALVVVESAAVDSKLFHRDLPVMIADELERMVGFVPLVRLLGVLIGLLCGGVVALVGSWMESDPAASQLGGAVGTAVAVAVAWAAVLGGVVPIGCRRLGIDPAIVAGPFLICLSDISGSAIYVAVARTLLD